MSSDEIKVGISACLLGEKVRYDGGHQLDPFLASTLGRFVRFVPVCPEVECGLPVPREPMRLEGDPGHPRLMTRHTRIDHTERMLAWAGRRVEELAQENLSGFIFKSKSPSSGMERIKVYTETGMVKKGVGMFARELMARLPLLPVEDEGRLHDPGLRENFIERLFVYQRWRRLLRDNPGRGGLVEFHTDHKLLIMAHSPEHERKLGRLVAQAAEHDPKELFTTYERQLMAGLRLKATPKKNANVLQHLMGYFKKQLSADEKKELQEVIDNTRREILPLIVPITLINHYVRKYGEPYLARQWYLHPHPIELKLRNHA
ncbi:MAG: DUF523 and DUF1722 domain-containing protein [Deltaproteobacteria bacterium]|jgi:uncharacterized protein YbgA (DUF1722 family)/uncharacterized protein YbbK (DUF523 family)